MKIWSCPKRLYTLVMNIVSSVFLGLPFYSERLQKQSRWTIWDKIWASLKVNQAPDDFSLNCERIQLTFFLPSLLLIFTYLQNCRLYLALKVGAWKTMAKFVPREFPDQLCRLREMDSLNTYQTASRLSDLNQPFPYLSIRSSVSK